MIIVISSLSLSLCVCACPVFYIYIDSTHILSSSLSRLSFFFCSIFFSSYLIKKKVLCPLPIPLFSFLVWTWTLSSSLVGKDFLSLSISLSLSLFLFFFTLPCSCLHFLPQEHATFCVFCFCFCFCFFWFAEIHLLLVFLSSLGFFPPPSFVCECLFLVFVFVFVFLFVLFTFRLCSVSPFLTTVFYWVSLFFLSSSDSPLFLVLCCVGCGFFFSEKCAVSFFFVCRFFVCLEKSRYITYVHIYIHT